jgi:two-component system response regulator ResD
MPDRILVVDDEEPIREIVASMLGTAGYLCKQAGSGTEALAVLTSGEEFELMLSDLMACLSEPKRSIRICRW